ncbi:hypothetical protein B0H34DRAFT_796245 [Crassisporium funariophilum]|nr:hypothetical protein B0H34DRAFT_796245 [Crassisporium funariophilum]
MSKPKQSTSTKLQVVAPKLRKAQSSPSMTGMPEEENMPFPIELQQQISAMKAETTPERWMCVVIRREKVNYAVGRLVDINNVTMASSSYFNVDTDRVHLQIPR